MEARLLRGIATDMVPEVPVRENVKYLAALHRAQSSRRDIKSYRHVGSLWRIATDGLGKVPGQRRSRRRPGQSRAPAPSLTALPWGVIQLLRGTFIGILHPQTPAAIFIIPYRMKLPSREQRTNPASSWTMKGIWGWTQTLVSPISSRRRSCSLFHLALWPLKRK